MHKDCRCSCNICCRSLQGRSPGVVVSNTSWEPGSEPSIFVRGKRSITASNGPLYVVDGIPITGGVSEISPADIESMEILKMLLPLLFMVLVEQMESLLSQPNKVKKEKRK